ncbi:hypothetical protein E2C01_102810 [Portunus trituberculatus]|uniref:Uncharacterized protein n=1 Tax=Portunus trituberculatus TaxID=210409 RepID=A0A5B7KDI9_PORTR|nr:hypothetical protein [Portunus trituberculatus]
MRASKTVFIVYSKAYVYERLNLEVLIAQHFTNKGGFTPLYVARENIVPGYCGWPLSPNTPFKSNLDHCILAFHGAGLIEKWTKEILERTQFDSRQRMNTVTDAEDTYSEDQDVEIHQVTTKALTLIHMQSPLFLFVAGAFLSFGVFIGESCFALSSWPNLKRFNRPSSREFILI